ncbi:MAG: hypothetical protein H6Q70_60 [Firmicutes bacterium]|nr:hypothetical protein [Bacillota bacterium]
MHGEEVVNLMNVWRNYSMQTKSIGEKLVDRDVAIEIMADMIGKRNIEQMNTDNLDEKNRLEKEIDVLLFERDEMYSGNETVIEKFLNVYSKEIKAYYGMLNND